MKNQNIHIGTSGWHYGHWAGNFYSSDLPKENYLDFYCQHFRTVEINNSFYQLPEVDTLEAWREQVPDDFTFSVKASRYITHMKKLKDPQEPVSVFMERIAALRDHLGPVLFQLPPHWRSNPERLGEFMDVLSEGFRYTFEFRDESWFDERIIAILRNYRAAFCIYHLDGQLSPKEVTADFVYIRLHGQEGAYQWNYSIEELAGWAGAISSWSRQGKQVFCYFDNDERGFAPQNAAQLRNMLQDG
ncbi:MAG: DUF72 domain-containing protein [Anaerolineales bacterium]|jgi:uncharacterized protein YecE (DUF72 family)